MDVSPNCFVFKTADEIRIASMSSIMANGALIAGDFRAAEEFFKEARYGLLLIHFNARTNHATKHFLA